MRRPFRRAVESPNDSDRNAIAIHESCLRNSDTRCLREVQGQNFALRDRPVVIDARELSDAERAVIVDH